MNFMTLELVCFYYLSYSCCCCCYYLKLPIFISVCVCVYLFFSFHEVHFLSLSRFYSCFFFILPCLICESTCLLRSIRHRNISVNHFPFRSHSIFSRRHNFGLCFPAAPRFFSSLCALSYSTALLYRYTICKAHI